MACMSLGKLFKWQDVRSLEGKCLFGATTDKSQTSKMWLWILRGDCVFNSAIYESMLQYM